MFSGLGGRESQEKVMGNKLATLRADFDVIDLLDDCCRWNLAAHLYDESELESSE